LLLSHKILAVKFKLKMSNFSQHFTGLLLSKISDLLGKVFVEFMMDENVSLIMGLRAKLNGQFLKTLNQDLETKLSKEKLSEEERSETQSTLKNVKKDLKFAEELLATGNSYEFNRCVDEISKKAEILEPKLKNQTFSDEELREFYIFVNRLIEIVQFFHIIWEDDELNEILVKLGNILRVIDRLSIATPTHLQLFIEYLLLFKRRYDIFLTEHVLTADEKAMYNQEIEKCNKQLEEAKVQMSRLEADRKKGFK